MNNSSLPELAIAVTMAGQRLAIAFGVMGTIGLLGNVALFGAVATNGELWSKSSLLLASLALVECAICCNYLLGSGSLTWTYWLGGRKYPIEVCYAVKEIPRIFLALNTMVFLSSLAVDRYLLLRFPVRYAQIETKNYIGFWWFLGISFGIWNATLLFYHRFEDYPFDTFCLYFFLARKFVTLLLIIVPNMAAARLAGKQAKSVGQTNKTGAKMLENFQRSLKIVVLVFFASWVIATGLYAYYLAAYPKLANGQPNPGFVDGFVYILVICGNPVIYYTRNGEYRRAMRRFMCIDGKAASQTLFVSRTSRNSRSNVTH